MKIKKPTKKYILDYLKSERTELLELDLSEDIIQFLHKQADEMSKKAGVTVEIGDALGIFLSIFIKHHKDLLIDKPSIHG
jgi:hypothetical protein